MPRPRCFKNPRIRNFFLLRWLYEGFNDQELLYIMGVGTGLLIGFGAGGRIELRP